MIYRLIYSLNLKLLLTSVFFLIFKLTFSQKLIFEGKVVDKNGIPLEGANVLLNPSNLDLPPSFSTTNKDGDFSMLAFSNSTYELSITYIGFKTIRNSFQFSTTPLRFNFTMFDEPQELEEVILDYKPPIDIKQDTMSYKVTEFSNGKERKLKELLAKLPGVEINQEGEVFVRNKKITKVFVENKTFFNGKTQFAVQNIPSNVVDEIEIIEDFHDISFLKGFSDSEHVAMNIKLKEGSQNFFFGDIQLGSNFSRNNIFHPSLFNYDEKLSLNLIGDYNNTPQKSFSLKDYFSILQEDLTKKEDIENLINSPLAKFITNEDYFKSKYSFTGANAQYNPGETNEVKLFISQLSDKNSIFFKKNVSYLASATDEYRTIDKENYNQLLNAKLTYKITPNKNTVLEWDSSLDFTDLKSNYLSKSNTFNNFLNLTNQDASTSDQINSKLELSKYFSSKNASIFKLYFGHNKESLIQNWISQNNVFNPKLPIVNDSLVDVKAIEKESKTTYGIEFSDFYRPSVSDLLTIRFSGRITQNCIKTKSFQNLVSGDVINFDEYINHFSSGTNNIETSISYSRYFDNINMVVGLNHQIDSWIDESQNVRKSFWNNYITPKLKVELELNEAKVIKFIYEENRNNPISKLRLTNKKVEDFNFIIQGNSSLEQYFTNRLLLSYSSFQVYGISIFSNVSYGKTQNPIFYSSSFEGISGIRTPIQINSNNKRFKGYLRIKKNKRYWNLSLANDFYYGENFSILNSIKTKNLNKTFSSILSFETNFEEFLNFAINVSNFFNSSNNQVFTVKTNINKVNISVKHDFKRWKFNLDILQTFYKNISRDVSSNFNNLKGSIFYHQENSRWEFGLNFFNMGNVSSKITNYSTSDIFNEESLTLFPRTILLNVFYKL